MLTLSSNSSEFVTRRHGSRKKRKNYVKYVFLPFVTATTTLNLMLSLQRNVFKSLSFMLLMPSEQTLNLSEAEQRLRDVREAFESVQSRYSGISGFFRGLFGLRSGDQKTSEGSVAILSSLYTQSSNECRDIASRSIEDYPVQLRREIAHLRQDIRDYIIEFNEDDDLED